MKTFVRSSLILFYTAIVVIQVVAQGQTTPRPPSPSDPRRDDPTTVSVREMLTNQRLAKERKDHAELLKRGESALALAAELDAAFTSRGAISDREKEKLEALEKLVLKIRKSLGADGEDASEPREQESQIEARKPPTVEVAFGYLKKATAALVDELKKTSRFAVSGFAIRSTNNVLNLIRSLRFRR